MRPYDREFYCRSILNITEFKQKKRIIDKLGLKRVQLL
jgi:hypothetical protein